MTERKDRSGSKHRSEPDGRRESDGRDEPGEASEPGARPPRRTRFAGWILGGLAPADAGPALADLEEERDRSLREGASSTRAAAGYWLQLAGVCLWALADRLTSPYGRRAPRGPSSRLGTRRTRGRRPLHAFSHALRLAVRGIARTPGIALSSAVTLGVGLSAGVVILGVYFGMTRPLPLPDPHEIVELEVRDARSAPTRAPAGVLDVWRTAPGLDGVGAVRAFAGTLVHPTAPATRVYAAEMTPGLAELLGARPVRGRLPGAGTDDRNALLVGWRFWQDALEADPEIVGTTVRLDGRPMTVVGVMPADFGFPENQSAWTVMDPAAGALPGGTEIVARLADGARTGTVVPTLERGLAGLPATATADAPGPLRVSATSWAAGRGESGELYALLALGLMAAVLLAVCAANVSTLLLVRATERVSTLAVHAAMGATRGQVVLHLLLEALLVTLAGGALGLLIGWAGLYWIETNLSVHWGYFWMEMGVRPGVLAGTFLAVLGAAALAGTAPALMALRTDLRSVMGGRPDEGGGRGRPVARWFAGAQLTLSTVGVVAALVLADGFRASSVLVERLPLDDVALGTVTPDGADYPDAAARATLADRIRASLAAQPGVTAATVGTGAPGHANAYTAFQLADRDPDLPPLPVAFWMGVDDHVLDTYGLKLLAGRTVGASDGADDEAVVMVNRAFADRWLAPGDPLGRRLRLEGVHGAERWARVVGVVENHYPDRPELRADRVFVPLGQTTAATLLVSVRGLPGQAAEIVPRLQEGVAAVDRTLAVEQPWTLRALTDWMSRMPRVMAGFGILGGLAGLLVSAMGLYGLVAFQVRSRIREVGVRMALGAGNGTILREVVAGTLRGVLPPLLAGLGIAFLIAPGLVIFTFGEPPRAPLPFLLAALTILGVAAAAALVPALRAARTDPQRVLRAD